MGKAAVAGEVLIAFAHNCCNQMASAVRLLRPLRNPAKEHSDIGALVACNSHPTLGYLGDLGALALTRDSAGCQTVPRKRKRFSVEFSLSGCVPPYNERTMEAGMWAGGKMNNLRIINTIR